jgi:hypothetical protein
MKKGIKILPIILVSFVMGLSSACQKKEDAAAGNPGPVVVAPPAPPCVPDVTGTYPSGCVQSINSGRNAGEFVVDSGTQTSFTRMLSDNIGYIEHMSTVYSQLPLDRMPQLPGLPGGSIYPPTTSFGGAFRCGTGKMSVCTRECKNYGNGGILLVEVNNGTGFVTIKAGPYNRPGGFNLCSGSQQFLRTYYSIRIPVRMFAYNDNRGFSLQSISSVSPYGGIMAGNPNVPGYDAVFRITAPVGNLTDEYVNVSLHYRGIPLGQAVLVRN